MRSKIRNFQVWLKRQNKEEQKFIKTSIVWSIVCLIEIILICAFSNSITHILNEHHVSRFGFTLESFLAGAQAYKEVFEQSGILIWVLFILFIALLVSGILLLFRSIYISRSDQFKTENIFVHTGICLVNMLLFVLLAWLAYVPVIFLIVSFILVSLISLLANK